MRWVCEWCKPSDAPAINPTTCRICYCAKHGCKTWHYPVEDEQRPDQDKDAVVGATK